MKTIILCGGQGTRLREETEYKPKPMVMIGSKPILWHIMQLYAAYGFKEFVLALGYRGHMIRDYFLNYECYNNDFTLTLGNHKEIEFHGRGHNESNWRVTLAETGEETLTGGRVKLCSRFIDSEHFFLTYGDGLANVNLQELLAFHKKHGKLATVTGVNPPSRWGELGTKESGQVHTFMEKGIFDKSGRHVNGGFFVFRREIFKYFTDDPNCILETDVLTQIAKDDQLMMFQHDGFWYAMDTYRDYLYLNELSHNGQTPWAARKAQSV